MAKLSVTIERNPNQLVTDYHVGQNISSYHTRIWLCLKDGQLAHAAGSAFFLDPDLKNMDKRTRLLAELLFAIPSVVSERFERPVTISGDTVRITRDDTRTDEEVETEVLVAIAAAFGISGDDIEATIDDHQRSEEYIAKCRQASAHDMAWSPYMDPFDDHYDYTP
jgi:hypothetical protein